MTAAATWQLAWGLVLVLVILVAASGARRTWAIGLLLLLIPFQMVDTRYASSSVLMTYVLAGVLLINGHLKVRLLSALGMIVLAYFVSLSQSSRELVPSHVIYMFVFFSSLVVFLLAYNFARLVEDERTIVDVLLAVNVLTVIYCVLQISAGPGASFQPLGIDAFAFNENRHAGDARLVGPFSNPGCTAGYFTLMILVCAVEQMFATGRRRRLVQALIVLNVIGLVATGNRTGLLILVAMYPVTLFAFRRELGAKRFTQYFVGGVSVLAIASAVAISYTGFGRMFERLGTVTETEGGVPTTRTKTWPVAIERIKQAPLLGEGPRYISPEDAENLRLLRTLYDPYPHSLYLHQLRTVGVIGLAALLWFFYQVASVLRQAVRDADATTDGYRSALLRLGLLLLVAFLGAQITLEFNRQGTMDYGHFIFALFGMFVGIADRVSHRVPVSAPERSTAAPRAAQVPLGRSAVR